jgi:hypothetical protein
MVKTIDDRTLTAADLARLLARLDADPDRAALQYERLRRALVRFFDWRGASAPDRAADQTLDRVARRLDDTVIEDVSAYALGVARLVLLEQRRQPMFVPIDESDAETSPTRSPDPSAALHDCLDVSLARLAADERRLVIGYYTGRGGDKVANRRRLAATLGISDNALRSRVQRLRDRLERAIRACVEGERR